MRHAERYLALGVSTKHISWGTSHFTTRRGCNTCQHRYEIPPLNVRRAFINICAGAACLIDDLNSHGKPNDEQLKHWAEARKAAISVELQERDGAARAPAKVDMSDKAQKKRLEREARKAQQQQQKQEAEDNVLQPTVAESSNVAPAQQTYTVHVPGPSAELPWYEPKAYHTIDEARAAGIWEYPRDVKERAECAVFHDLWEKGNYLGPGIKFGGNYLVYPG